MRSRLLNSRLHVSTSLLSRLVDVGQRKTRRLAAWAEHRGFRTSLVERPFAADFTVGSHEPSVALIGVDNPLARRLVEKVGFARIVDAGLGKGPGDFLGLSLHTFPASRSAQDCWPDTQPSPTSNAAETDLEAYRRLKDQSGDRCGVLRLANRSIATPFTGAVAGAMVVAELLRLSHGQARTEFVSVHLARPEVATVCTGDPWSLHNSGTVKVDVA